MKNRVWGAPLPAAFRTGSSRPAAMTCARRARLSLLPALALLLAALGPFAAAPAAAQTVWSATLTVTLAEPELPELGSGCSDASSRADSHCEPSGALTDDDFSYRGVATSIHTINYGSTGLVVTFGSNLPEGYLDGLVLVVGNQRFPLADKDFGDSSGFENNHTQFDATIPGFTVGNRVRVSLKRFALGALTVHPYDGYLNFFWRPAPGPVTGYDVHYTASRTAAPNARVGANPATGWAAVPGTGGLSASTGHYVHPVRGLTNGRTYWVRARAKYGAVDTAWAFGSGTPAVPPAVVFTPDENLLTGIAFNDGVRDLPVEPNFAYGTGFGGPGIYMVHVPPGVKSLTMTPTWTTTTFVGLGGSVSDITRGVPLGSVTWSATESGTGKTIRLGQGNGSTLVHMGMLVSGSSDTADYRFLLTHHAGWRSASDRLKQLRIRATQ